MWSEWQEEKDGLEGPRWPSKKRSNPNPTTISSFFGSVMPYSRNDLQQKQFEEDLALFIAKELMPLSFVEAPFFRRLVLRQNPHLNFPSRRVLVLVNEILLKITKKTKEKYISLALEYYNTRMVSFDLWMFRVRVDTFVFIAHFWNNKWEPYHLAIGFFKIVKTSRNAMAL